MRVLKVVHSDFVLEVESKKIAQKFKRAQLKQSDIFSSTFYKVNSGDIEIFDFETNQLVRSEGKNTHPLFFENTDYFLSVTFKNKSEVSKPYIYSKIKEVEEKFFFREELGFLSGTINYDNNIGKSDISLRYIMGGANKEFTLSYEVFPIKLDYRNDYNSIVRDIEKEYPYLVLDFLKKTYSTFKTGNSPNTDLIWWQVFGGLYNDFISASKFILNRPHRRIVKETRYLKADRITNWTNALEEKVHQNKHLPNKIYRSEYKSLSIDTSENKLFKNAVIKTFHRYKKIKQFIESRYSRSITDNFKSELSGIEKQLKTISINPFFKGVGDFKGISQESLVLQKATGYSTIYKSWIMLNSGISFLDGIQKIELKKISELYQIWSFLEIKNVVQDILGKESPDEVDLAEIQIDDFVFRIEQGVKSKISFVKENGDLVELFHEYSYRNSKSRKERSFTINQKPDIVLKITKNDLLDNYAHTYLYDAKYRLASDDKEGAPDIPPDDAINQMHRYRDAIYYVNKDDKNKPEKEVIGAYILFPGKGESSVIKELPYYKSIEEVNIGAFPLAPNDRYNRGLLRDHLVSILESDSENMLKEVSPQKGSIYEDINPYVLIGFVPTEEHAKCFESDSKPFYYSGEQKPTKFGFNNLKYFAPYIKGKGVKEYYEILDYRLVDRSEIFERNHPLFKNDNSERLVIRLGEKFKIGDGEFYKLSDGSIGYVPYRYTNLKNIRRPINDKIKVVTVSKRNE